MAPAGLLFCVLAYFGLLYLVAWRTSRRAGNAEFFVGGRDRPWPLVAFGMIGTSLSGVTFISVPGSVASGGFTYWQVVLGYLFGYALVAFILLPLYYRLGHVSIYAWLAERLGMWGWQTAAVFFLISRTLGATARLYLVIRILQDIILDGFGIPFAVSTVAIMALIMLYTWRGGVKTIVWTDTLQTAGMLIGLGAGIAFILNHMPLSPAAVLARMNALGLTRVWGTEPAAADFWLKQMLAGAAIALAMTGMDQELMQKNISVRTLRGAQTNVAVMAVAMQAMVVAFLMLGGLLTLFANERGLQAAGDRLFPAVVTGYMPAGLQIVFVLALISALFPSADGALTALTSSCCNDLLRFEQRADLDEGQRIRIRHGIHLVFAVLFAAVVLGFRWIDSPSMISLILTIAAYTYGPLLGLFAFALMSRRAVRGPVIAAAAVTAPLVCMALDAMQAKVFGPWRIGLEMLLINGALMYGILALAALTQARSAQAIGRPGSGTADHPIVQE